MLGSNAFAKENCRTMSSLVTSLVEASLRLVLVSENGSEVESNFLN